MERPYISSLDLHFVSRPARHIDSLSPHVNVIYGPNESGKSLMKSFIEWMMFASSPGFEALSPKAKKDAFSFNSIEPSGSMTLSFALANNSVTFSQRIENKKIVTSLSSSTYSQSDIIHLLTDDIDIHHFRNVFSLSLKGISHDDSQHFLTSEAFLSAGQAGSGLSWSGLVAALENSAETFYNPNANARKNSINKVLLEIESTNSAIRELQRQRLSISSLTNDLDELGEQDQTLSESLTKLSSQLDELRQLHNNFQTYRSYQELSTIESPHINTDLISNIGEIEYLIKESHSRTNDENKRDNHSIKKMELSTELDDLQETLHLTRSSTEFTPAMRSTEFRSSLLTETEAQKTYAQDRSHAQNDYDRETAQHEQLIQQVELITQDHEATSDVVLPAHTRPEVTRSSAAVALGMILCATGIACALASVLTGQFIGLGAGVVLIIAGAITFATSKSEHPTEVLVAPSTVEYNFAHLQSQIQQHETNITFCLNKLSELDHQRSRQRAEFEKILLGAGFERPMDPTEVGIYLEDLKKYDSVAKELERVENEERELTLWFQKYFDRVNALFECAVGTTSARTKPIETLTEAQSWLESLHIVGIDHQRIEKEVHERESMIRSQEKFLTEQFTSLETAKKMYAPHTLESLRDRIKEAEDEYANLQLQQRDVISKVAELNKEVELSHKDRQMRDILAHKQSLIEELSYLHQEYIVHKSAQTVAERTLSDYQNNHQPVIFQRASEHMAFITAGRWTRISVEYMSKGKSTEPVVLVSGPDGVREPHQLSLGTQDQLYLSLRLALMETSPRGQFIPVLFDDVSVNIDHTRFSQLAPLIARAGEHRQIFYFTHSAAVRDELMRHPGTHLVPLTS